MPNAQQTLDRVECFSCLGARGPRGPRRGTSIALGPRGFKGYVRGVPGGQGGGLWCPIGLTAIFDGSSDDM